MGQCSALQRRWRMFCALLARHLLSPAATVAMLVCFIRSFDTDHKLQQAITIPRACVSHWTIFFFLRLDIHRWTYLLTYISSSNWLPSLVDIGNAKYHCSYYSPYAKWNRKSRPLRFDLSERRFLRHVDVDCLVYLYLQQLPVEHYLSLTNDTLFYFIFSL